MKKKGIFIVRSSVIEKFIVFFLTFKIVQCVFIGQYSSGTQTVCCNIVMKLSGNCLENMTLIIIIVNIIITITITKH